MADGSSVWYGLVVKPVSSNESINYVHGHLYIHLVDLAQVDCTVAPVNDLSSVVQCDLTPDGSSRLCIGNHYRNM